MWREICHVEKFLHMRDVETNLICHNSCCFVAKSVLLPFTLFCRRIYLVAIYAFLRGEKFNQKFRLWRKRKNMRYTYPRIMGIAYKLQDSNPPWTLHLIVRYPYQYCSTYRPQIKSKKTFLLWELKYYIVLCF